MDTSDFSIDVPQATLDDLHQRLKRTRLPDAVHDAGWDYGTDLAYLADLLSYYRDGFDWRAQERRLNSLPQHRATVQGLGLHFVHVRSKVTDAMPLLLVHGWPDSFLRMEKLIPRLTDPVAHGAEARDAFHVIVPSIPGFAFSDRPRARGMSARQVAALFGTLMQGLGYTRYGAHGGDWGSVVTDQLAQLRGDALAGIHLTDVPFVRMLATPRSELSEGEKRYLAAGKMWQMTEGAYALQQGTKPQTLSFGLNDSPAGLCAWIVEKFRSWSDCRGDIESRFSKDELLTNVTLYWVTETIHSACRLYYETARDMGRPQPRVEVPTAVAQFPADMVPAPREFAERHFNLQRWTTMPRGGHFAAMEEPELLADDLRQFFRGLR
jgi:pimeloyl-ACP methyl ester carboxylesterase